MTRWGVVIDLEKCIGCKACSIVCAETYGPESNWRTVYNLGVFRVVDDMRISIPVSCMHCMDAPCVDVCPTTASYIRPDGIVDIDYNKCVGCGYCIIGCPYQVRSISHSGKVKYSGEMRNHEASEITTKCTLCSEKIDTGMKQGHIPGIDKEATPECVVTCSIRAITFGNIEDPNSDIYRLLKKVKLYTINTDLHTQPSLFYIFTRYSRVC